MKRAFISFDYDHDDDLKTMLIGQSRHPDTPFTIADWSIKDHVHGDWRAEARRRIRLTDLTIVICGQWTHTAQGVAIELSITQSEQKPYFLLWGRAGVTCTLPTTALSSDKLYKWTWDNLKSLIAGVR